MSGKAASEAVFLCQKGILELDDAAERVASKQCARHVHLAAVWVVIAPAAHRIVVFQGKAQGIDLVMAAFAIGPFAMVNETFTQCEVRFALPGFLIEGRHVRGGVVRVAC